MSEEETKKEEVKQEEQAPYILIRLINDGNQTQFETNVGNLIIGLGLLEAAKDFIKVSIAKKAQNQKKIIPARHGILNYLRGNGNG